VAFPQPARLGFLASHRGSNLQAVVDACAAHRLPAQPALVISNNAGSGALQRARDAGIPALLLNAANSGGAAGFDAAIALALKEHRVDVVLLAGWMLQLGSATLAAYPGRILNIHPALLPKFGGRGMYGRHVHEAVLAAGETETGATVHLVDAGYDTGRILAQRRVPVRPDDDVERLGARVLEVEHELYVDTLRDYLAGRFDRSAGAGPIAGKV
jgi:phosphoribosylglycinamide formyltransferase-1